jgi:hypothetical protein
MSFIVALLVPTVVHRNKDLAKKRLDFEIRK